MMRDPPLLLHAPALLPPAASEIIILALALRGCLEDFHLWKKNSSAPQTLIYLWTPLQQFPSIILGELYSTQIREAHFPFAPPAQRASSSPSKLPLLPRRPHLSGCLLPHSISSNVQAAVGGGVASPSGSGGGWSPRWAGAAR